ncbi:MAG: lycopene beta-cyclase [Vicingaceae bacterium]
MSKELTFDYTIIGGGLAGMQLALAFCRDSFFDNKSIAILEPDSKTVNDKTWCFWEKGGGQWDSLLRHRWEKGMFYGPQKSIPMNFGEYSYKMLPSINFYEFAKAEIARSTNVRWIKDRVTEVTGNDIKGEKDLYHSAWIFDSRVPAGFEKDSNSITLLQPFKGWVIETEKDEFNPESFTFMDYRLAHEDKTCFTYVLPISKRKALVEFTFFVPELIDRKVYDEKLKQFISEKLEINSYSISEIEEGVIPMSSYAFWKDNKEHYLKIGTGGGWVKASTGYSFKSAERKVNELIKALKLNTTPKPSAWEKRFRFYDEVLLNILYRQNRKGPEVFERMYAKNEAYKIFKFLDEETTFAEELKIMWNTNRPLFVKSAVDVLKRKNYVWKNG